MRLVLVVAVCCVAAAAAFAQSSPQPGDGDAGSPDDGAETIELAGGGLVFVPDDRLSIEAQEVVLARASVRVTYAVRNTASEPIARVVSWPLPELDMASIGDDVVVLPGSDARNFAAAAIAVDGQRMTLDVEQWASAFAHDVTGLLEGLSLPLNPKAGAVEAQLKLLAAERIADLEERGVVRRDDDRILPSWSVRTTLSWRQVFEAGKLATIGLAYAPISASGLWRPDGIAALRDAYCIDKKLEEAIAARLAASPRGLVTHRVTYATTTAGSAGKAVPNFRLAIEKPGLESIVATCRGDLRYVGPTLVEWVGRDVMPGDDIRVLFID